MSTSTPPPVAVDETSYTAMETADVEAIGAHCQMPFCRQLDFLPFRCDSCHATYCLDHRTETAHSCPKAGEWLRQRRLQNASSPTQAPLSSKPTVLTAQQCSNTTCKTFINTTQSQAVHCTTCNRHYCLKHRFPEEHDCKNLVPLGARPGSHALQSNADKIREGFSKFKIWGKEKQTTLLPKPKPTSKAVQLVALNNLKKNAKGDAKVPADKRVYLHVEAESFSDNPARKDLYFSQDWPVGRVLDEAARAMGVQNNNNSIQTEEGRLRVYHVEAGRVLTFSEKIGQCVQSGNTVVLLRGVGDPGT